MSTASTAPALQPADPSSPVVPSREDGVVAQATEIIGGPVGEHAVAPGGRRLGTVWALVAAVTALVAAGVVERAHCLSVGWSSPDHFWHACYSDIPVVYGASTLTLGANPFAPAAHVDQPVPTALLAWLLALAVPDGRTGIDGARWYFGLWAVLVTVLLVLVAGSLVGAMRRHPWRVAHLASPALPFVALVSFEAVPVALAGLGVAAWGRRRPLLAGALLGAACLARPWAVLIVIAIGLLSVRAGRLGPWLRVLAAAAVTAVAGLVLAAMAGGSPLGVYTGWWTTGASYGSPWFLASLAGLRWTPGILSALGVAGWIVALVVGGVFALSLPRRPRVGEVALVMLVVVMLTGKSLPVQAGLWMILLMALVGVRWRTHLAWAGVEVAYFVAVWLHIAATSAPDRGLPAGWYTVFVVARLAAWAWIAVEVWRRAASRPAARLAGAEPAAVASTAPEPVAGDAASEHVEVPVADRPVARSHMVSGAAVVLGAPEEPGDQPTMLPSEAGGPAAEPTSGATAGSALPEPSGAGALSAHSAPGVPAPRRVVEDDDLAGLLAGAPDDTVVTFV